MALRRGLSSYSSAESMSSVSTFGGGDDSDSTLPSATPSAMGMFRLASVESAGRGEEWSGEEDDDVSPPLSEDPLRVGNTPGSTPRFSRTLGIPSTITERHAARHAPILARTRSSPLPPRPSSPSASSGLLPSMAAAAEAAAASAAAVAASSTCALPSVQPGFGASQSWTHGQPPPAPYQGIEPLSPEQQLIDEQTGRDSRSSRGSNDRASEFRSSGREHASLLDSSYFPPPSPSFSSPWWSMAGAPPGLSLGLGVDGSGIGLDADSVSRAPPPSRAPSLVRQKGVYVENSSRALSMPFDARQRMQQQMARELAAGRVAGGGDALGRPSHFSQEQAPPSMRDGQPLLRPAHSVPQEEEQGGEGDPADHDADSDSLPPLG